MNWIDIVLLALVGAAVVWAVRRIRKDKGGCGGCSGGCASCGQNCERRRGSA